MALVILNAVGLTPRLLPLAPRLHALATRTWMRPLIEVIPAVTCTAQATLLTGTLPEQHGIVGNGWLFRETGEVRFWQQSNRLLQAEPLYTTAARRAREQGKTFRCAKLFWWFNQGAPVEISLTPKPYYAADGNKAFGVHGTPEGLAPRIEKELGPFPFFTFWGPKAGLACTRWIARATASILQNDRPDLTLAYLPHLDYDPQRFGPGGSDMARLVEELDTACAPVLDAAQKVGAAVWVVSEYGHCKVSRAVLINRVLREAGYVSVRPGPFGEVLDLFNSRAFAVCDHQVAHVYVPETSDRGPVSRLLEAVAGVASVVPREESALGLNHERSGELIALSTPDAWFAYPFWLDDRQAPDYACTVDIHRKPGYDPCELFFDPKLWWPTGRMIRRLIQKKLGFRTLFDVIPLDASLVKGSHGLRSGDDQDRPLLIADGPVPSESTLPMTAFRDRVLSALGLV